jgi:DHA1 family bicyclomycin/chloramphenicol resistance-like MFS transporter
MQTQRVQIELPFFTLLLMISFAAFNAVLFTPALPAIANFFAISINTAQQTVTWFLIGYTLGQLVYGPLANRYGRRPALFIGIGLQVISSILCAFSGIIHHYWLLVLSIFLVALGSGVGLKMAFTLVNECYEPKVASQKIAYLMLAFAIAPGVSMALGGILTNHLGWMSCFYLGAIYGVILLFLVSRLPETQMTLDFDAFKIDHLISGYFNQFKNIQLVAGGILMGISTAFVYTFAAAAPFVAINLLGMNSQQYGIANILPPIGLIFGSLCSAQSAKKAPLQSLIGRGIIITSAGVILMIIAIFMTSALLSLFLPMFMIYFGLAFVIANASTIAMSQIDDKAHGSSVMNFINMAIATIAVLSLGLFHTTTMTLPIMFITFYILMIVVYKWIVAYHFSSAD